LSDKNSYRNNNPGKNRIVSLVIGFFILFVVTFSLGIIVGKGLTKRSATFTENKETIPPRVRVLEKPIDTEQEEVLMLDEKITEPDVEPEEPPKEISTEAPEDLQVKENIQEESAIEVPKPLETPQVQKADSEQKESLAKTPSTVKPEPVVKKPATTPKPEKMSRETAIEEIAKTDKNKREGRAKLPPIDPEGSYTVQIGSFTDKKAADSVLKSMKNKGYPAYVSTMTASDKKKWYRVRIGTFESSQSASDYGENLKVLEPEVKIVFITQNK